MDPRICHSRQKRAIGRRICNISREGKLNAAADEHAYYTSARLVIHLDAAGAGAEIPEGILGVDAALDGVALHHDITLGILQRLAHGDFDLGAYQINARYFLGNRVFHTFGITAAGSTEVLSEPFVVIIALRTIITVRI